MSKKRVSRQPKAKRLHTARSEVEAFSAGIAPEFADWPAFQLAFTDKEFLLREELRPLRLQLEALKPEMVQQDQHIEATIVFFGSARIPEPEVAQEQLAIARQAAKEDPDNEALNHLMNVAKKICDKSRYYAESRKLSHMISAARLRNRQKFKFVVMTGGGPGLMEAANRGANEANAKSIALNILLPREQNPNPYVTPELCFQFHYFAIRKLHFLLRAQAVVVFPGGFGTLDELFETLTLIQTEKMEPIPILLFGKTYCDNVINFQAMVDEGVISPKDLALFTYVETAEEAWEIICNFYHLNSSD